MHSKHGPEGRPASCLLVCVEGNKRRERKKNPRVGVSLLSFFLYYNARPARLLLRPVRLHQQRARRWCIRACPSPALPAQSLGSTAGPPGSPASSQAPACPAGRPAAARAGPGRPGDRPDQDSRWASVWRTSCMLCAGGGDGGVRNRGGRGGGDCAPLSLKRRLEAVFSNHPLSLPLSLSQPLGRPAPPPGGGGGAAGAPGGGRGGGPPHDDVLLAAGGERDGDAVVGAGRARHDVSCTAGVKIT